MPNEYDNPTFFTRHSQMSRSKSGLSVAGEGYMLKDLLPDFAGKDVLDLGCGYGWHCKYAAEQGAQRILGIDASEKMLATARERNADEKITYRKCGIEEYDYPENTWDVVKYHHTLTQILMGLLYCGFMLEAVEEAGPSEEMLDLPGMGDELRRPMMLLVRVKISSN